MRYKSAALKKSDYETLARFRFEVRKFLHFSEEAARDQSLTPQQYQALLAIEGAPGRDRLTVGELAEQLQITAHSAVGLVNRLQRAELIERHTPPEDRRRVLISVTALGRKLLKGLASEHRRELRTVGPMLVKLLQQVEQL